MRVVASVSRSFFKGGIGILFISWNGGGGGDGCCYFYVFWFLWLLFCKSGALIVCYSVQCYKHHSKLFSIYQTLFILLIRKERKRRIKRSKQNIQSPKINIVSYHMPKSSANIKMMTKRCAQFKQTHKFKLPNKYKIKLFRPVLFSILTIKKRSKNVSQDLMCAMLQVYLKKKRSH